MGVTHTTTVVQRNFMMPMCFVIFDRDVWDNALFKVYTVIRSKYVRGRMSSPPLLPESEYTFHEKQQFDINKKKIFKFYQNYSVKSTGDVIYSLHLSFCFL
jgi:hypothetical protein